MSRARDEKYKWTLWEKSALHPWPKRYNASALYVTATGSVALLPR